MGATVSSANSPANTQASMADSTSLQSQQIHELKKMVSNIGKEKVEDEEADTAILDMMELMDDFDESMQDLIDEMGLDELMDTFETIKKDLTPEELKEITIKHRNKEMKDMVKADADYLKVIFDKMPTPSISITV